MNVVANKDGAVLIFAIMHSGIKSVLPAEHIDNKYTQLFNQAKNSGVKIIEYHVPLLDFYKLGE